MPEEQTPYLPIRVESVNRGLRLAGISSELPDIVARVDAVEARRDSMDKLTEAILYTPPIEREAATILIRVENQFKKPKPINFKPENLIKDIFEGINLDLSEFRKEGVKSLAKTLGRRVSRLLHPDNNDPIIGHLFPESEIRFLYSLAVSASEKGDLKKAQDVYLRIVPKYYQTLLSELRAKGMTIDEIAESYPEMLTDLETVRYTDHVKYPKEVHKRENEKALADEATKKIVQKKEREARGSVLLLLNQTIRVMDEYATEQNYPQEVLDKLKSILQKITASGFVTGSDLWYEEIHQSDINQERIEQSATSINGILRDIPLQVLSVAKSMAFKQQSVTVEDFNQLAKSANDLYDAVQLHHQELIPSPSPDQTDKLSQELLSSLENVLEGEEEKNLKDGLRIKRAKKPEGTIWDTLIQQSTHTEAGDATISQTENFIFIENSWWHHSSTQRYLRYRDRDGLSWSIPEHEIESRFEKTNSVTFISTLFEFEKKGKTPEESPLVMEARKYGYKPASHAQIKAMLAKIAELEQNH